MPSASKKRKAGRKAKKDGSPALETPGEINIDQDDGCLTPQTPPRANELDDKDRIVAQSEDCVDSEVPTPSPSQGFDPGNDGRFHAVPRSAEDWDKVMDGSESDRVEDFRKDPELNALPIQEPVSSIDNLVSSEHGNGLHHQGDAVEEVSSQQEGNLDNSVSSSSTERGFAESLGVTTEDASAEEADVEQKLVKVYDAVTTDGFNEPLDEKQVPNENLPDADVFPADVDFVAVPPEKDNVFSEQDITHSDNLNQERRAILDGQEEIPAFSLANQVSSESPEGPAISEDKDVLCEDVKDPSKISGLKEWPANFDVLSEENVPDKLEEVAELFESAPVVEDRKEVSLVNGEGRPEEDVEVSPGDSSVSSTKSEDLKGEELFQGNQEKLSAELVEDAPEVVEVSPADSSVSSTKREDLKGEELFQENQEKLSAELVEDAPEVVEVISWGSSASSTKNEDIKGEELFQENQVKISADLVEDALKDVEVISWASSASSTKSEDIKGEELFQENQEKLSADLVEDALKGVEVIPGDSSVSSTKSEDIQGEELFQENVEKLSTELIEDAPSIRDEEEVSFANNIELPDLDVTEVPNVVSDSSSQIRDTTSKRDEENSTLVNNTEEADEEVAEVSNVDNGSSLPIRDAIRTGDDDLLRQDERDLNVLSHHVGDACLKTDSKTQDRDAPSKTDEGDSTLVNNIEEADEEVAEVSNVDNDSSSPIRDAIRTGGDDLLRQDEGDLNVFGHDVGDVCLNTDSKTRDLEGENLLQENMEMVFVEQVNSSNTTGQDVGQECTEIISTDQAKVSSIPSQDAGEQCLDLTLENEDQRGEMVAQENVSVVSSSQDVSKECTNITSNNDEVLSTPSPDLGEECLDQISENEDQKGEILAQESTSMVSSSPDVIEVCTNMALDDDDPKDARSFHENEKVVPTGEVEGAPLIKLSHEDVEATVSSSRSLMPRDNAVTYKDAISDHTLEEMACIEMSHEDAEKREINATGHDVAVVASAVTSSSGASTDSLKLSSMSTKSNRIADDQLGDDSGPAQKKLAHVNGRSEIKGLQTSRFGCCGIFDVFFNRHTDHDD